MRRWFSGGKLRKFFAIFGVFFLFALTPAPAASAAAQCFSSQWCGYRDNNFVTEEWRTSFVYPNGHCIATSQLGARSYDNKSNNEGYFYSGTDCTGTVHAMTHHSNNANMGFRAFSYYSACVSCRTATAGTKIE